MDLNAYWQENRRFLLLVAGGVLAFLLGQFLIQSFIGGDLRAEQTALRRAKTKLAEPMYDASDLARTVCVLSEFRLHSGGLDLYGEFLSRDMDLGSEVNLGGPARVQAPEKADAPGYFLQWLCEQETVYGWPYQESWYYIGDMTSLGEAQAFYVDLASKGRPT